MAVEDYAALEGISAFVYFLLGGITLVLSKRTVNNNWNEKYAAIMFGWYLIFMGLGVLASYLSEMVQLGGGGDINWISKSSQMTVYVASSVRMSLPIAIALIFPYPFLQKKNSLQVAGLFTLIITILASGVFTFSESPGWFIFISLYMFPVLIWGFVYVRFSFKEMFLGDPDARTISSSAGLLIFAFGGVRIVDWLFWLLIPDRWIVTRGLQFWSTVEDFNMTSYFVARGLELSIAITASIAVFVFEGYRNFTHGNSLLSTISHMFFMIGIVSFFVNLSVLDILDQCVYDVCDGLPDSWLIYNTFTNNLAIFLFKPLIIMFVLLNYSLVDTKTDKNGTLARTMVILMVVIVSSTIIEMLQSIIPVGDIITSGILAIGIAAAIGWEENIMRQLLSFQESVNTYLKELDEIILHDYEPRQVRLFTGIMVIILAYNLLMSILHATLELGF